MGLVNKFLLHQPLNRQSKTYAREGIEIDVSTLADRVGACVVALDPIIEAIRIHVLSAGRIHADDTTVPVLAKLETVTGRIWTYVRDGRPLAVQIRRRPCSTTHATELESIRKTILPAMWASCRPTPLMDITSSTRPKESRLRSLKRPVGATAAESSLIWRNLERRRLPVRPCDASISCSRSSAPSTAKRQTAACGTSREVRADRC
jgi:Transposase IS66 family